MSKTTTLDITKNGIYYKKEQSRQNNKNKISNDSQTTQIVWSTEQIRKIVNKLHFRLIFQLGS